MRPAAFVDRDGTILVEREYLSDADHVDFIPGSIEALRELRRLGFAPVIVTNQSGIARGLYTENDFWNVQQRVHHILREHGVTLDAVYYCPHHPDFSGPCECRKPGPGMYRRAERELDADLRASVYIGDRLKDVEPALAFGGTGILVRTGYGAEEAGGAPPAIAVVSDLWQATLFIAERLR